MYIFMSRLFSWGSMVTLKGHGSSFFWSIEPFFNTCGVSCECRKVKWHTLAPSQESIDPINRAQNKRQQSISIDSAQRKRKIHDRGRRSDRTNGRLGNGSCFNDWDGCRVSCPLIFGTHNSSSYSCTTESTKAIFRFMFRPTARTKRHGGNNETESRLQWERRTELLNSEYQSAKKKGFPLWQLVQKDGKGNA